MPTEHCDFLVIGGGLFGVYAALYLERKGHKVILLEKEQRLFQKASVVNQARLHGGYHYPRSVATALMSDENKARFTEEHRPFILFDYEKYYAIDRFGSFTDAAQFQRFCDFINIPCEEVACPSHFNPERLEAVFRTREYTFDPFLIAQYYRQKVEQTPNLHVRYGRQVMNALADGGHWRVAVRQWHTGVEETIQAQAVINATYSAANSIHRIFGLDDLALMHEISEMAFVTSTKLAQVGLTVMDGPFASLMPYGRSGLLSLSSVAYTHHAVSYEALPRFDCQTKREGCTPAFTSVCNACSVRPPSNYPKMLAQIRQYLHPSVDLHYFSSMFTIKSKLKANAIDDGRPTEIALLHSQPPFYTLFAGKINSIYEIEKVL